MQASWTCSLPAFARKDTVANVRGFPKAPGAREQTRADRRRSCQELCRCMDVLSSWPAVGSQITPSVKSSIQVLAGRLKICRGLCLRPAIGSSCESRRHAVLSALRSHASGKHIRDSSQAEALQRLIWKAFMRLAPHSVEFWPCTDSPSCLGDLPDVSPVAASKSMLRAAR